MSTTYQIASKAGVFMGTFAADTPAAALLALHRHAGYGADQVWLVNDELVFSDGAAQRLLGDVDAWIITLAAKAIVDAINTHEYIAAVEWFSDRDFAGGIDDGFLTHEVAVVTLSAEGLPTIRYTLLVRVSADTVGSVDDIKIAPYIQEGTIAIGSDDYPDEDDIIIAALTAEENEEHYLIDPIDSLRADAYAAWSAIANEVKGTKPDINTRCGLNGKFVKVWTHKKIALVITNNGSGDSHDWITLTDAQVKAAKAADRRYNEHDAHLTSALLDIVYPD